MWLIILAYAILAVGAEEDSNGTAVFSKCCPAGESLMKTTDVDSFTQYSCATSELIETNYSVVVHPLVLGENVVAEYGMPEDCDDLILNEIGDELSMKNNHCYDRLALEVVNDTLKQNIPEVISLTCPSQQKNSSPEYQINDILKCCPNGKAYDIEYHVCRDDNEINNELWLKRLDPSGDYVYEVEYGLNCKLEEYAVELTEALFTFSVEGSNLKASSVSTSGNHLFMEGEWCADFAYGGAGLVVRGCTRDCQPFGAFCLTKCCPVGYHYEPRKCGSVVSTCHPDTDEANLYDLSYYLDPLKTDPDFNYGKILSRYSYGTNDSTSTNTLYLLCYITGDFTTEV